MFESISKLSIEFAKSLELYTFKVRLIDGSDKSLDELEVDDWVQTLKGAEVQYAPVSFWLHRVPHQKAEFHKIELSDGTELKLTAKHFIYKTTCPTAGEGDTVDELSRQAVFADKVNEGDCLYKVTEDERIITARVTKVSKVSETGIYSPMTSNGKIVVNGIYASCHNIVESYSLQNTFFSYVDTFRKWYSSIFGAHMGVDELPLGIDTLTTMMDYVIPKNLVTM
ncbi:hint module [Ancylostoma caninum]|uniref:Hint module n=1 Tax=Ancylostoma caninum TaxID=29170 RepID=A0A368F634_ANCCA|nr:hint module [Ancylostoma caninum]